MNQQLADRLISHYDATIELVKGAKDWAEAQRICYDRYANRGICFCANQNDFGEAYTSDWVESQSLSLIPTGYWATPPEQCATIPEIIESLQYRVGILKTFTE